jgi:DNA-binding GntR family transcriptional regulator
VIATPAGGSFGGSIASLRALLRDEVYTKIRTSIIQGQLAPGVHLHDKDIAQTFGVSRTPVREAIRRLQDEGLVVTEPSRWTKVAPVDTTIGDELYPIIGALERLAITLSGAWPREKVEELSAINNRLARAMQDGDDVLASQADAEFHGLVLLQSGNRRLEALLRELKVHLQRIRVVYFGGATATSDSIEEHQAVIAALADQDTVGAARAIEQNWLGPLNRLHERLGLVRAAPRS